MTKYLSTSNTKHWLDKIKLLFAIIFMVAFSVSCDTEDDINSIFVGNTWYVNGFTINGKSADGDEIKTLYADANAFSIFFSSSNSFNGMLSTGCTISGKWVANGKNQTIAISFKNPSCPDSSPIGNTVFNILKNAGKYSGDVNIIEIKTDNKNLIRLTRSRNP